MRAIATLIVLVLPAPALPGDDFREEIARRKAELPSFRPLVRPAPPPVRDAGWAANEIDRFILARLEAAGIRPAPPADSAAFLRRLSFDLVGLPPAPEEAEAFVRDASPAAAARAVERLLADPRFGEKWARHWLDLVRYAETRGHEFDHTIPNAWRYRDYVIRALNEDVPYDRFVLEHLAGDLLPEPRLHPKEGFDESVLGTGWWQLGEAVHSPVDIRGDEADRAANQIEVLGKAFLGLTVSCARCHDHKFDPVSQEDYTALAGFIKSSVHRQARIEPPGHNRSIARALEALEEGHREPVARAAGRAAAAWAATADLRSASADPSGPIHALTLLSKGEFAAGRRDLLARWTRAEEPPDAIVDYGRPGADDWIQDGLAFGSRPARAGELRLDGSPGRPLVRVFGRGAAAADPVWTGLGPSPGTERETSEVDWPQAGRTLLTPTFTLAREAVYVLARGSGWAFAEVDGHRMVKGPLHGATRAEWKEKDLGWRKLALGAYRSANPDRPAHRIHLEFTPRSADFEILLVVQADRPPPDPASLPNPRVLEAVGAADSIEDLERRCRALLAEAAGALERGRLAESPALAPLAAWLVERVGEDPGVVEAAGEFAARRAELAAKARLQAPTAPALMDAGPADEHLSLRGNAGRPRQVVPRRFLEALAGTSTPPRSTRSGRLELAMQVVDPKVAPLTPRVAVNRVWHHLLGRGIVASTDDFGKMGTPATHPELLDWLASTFVEDGWSLKALVRRIVLSSSYRMSTAAAPGAAEKDAANELFHRAAVRRLPAESIRDAMLSAAGRLDPSMFGPPVPVHLDRFQEGRGKPASGPLDGRGRRTIYLSVRRNFLSTMLLAFDFPQPFSCVGRRSVSNVPAQSLILRNGPFVHEMAAAWGRRLEQAGGPAGETVRGMFLAAYGRAPSAEESERAEAFAREAGWADLAHALFQAREFVYLN